MGYGQEGFSVVPVRSFFVAACAAMATWATVESLEQAVFWATYAAFFATASAFIDRLFPDERNNAGGASDDEDE